MGLSENFWKSWRNGVAVKSRADVIEGSMPQFGLVGFGSGVIQESCDRKNEIGKYRGWVYAAANKNSRAIASARLRLFATRATGQSKSRQKARPIPHEKFYALRNKAPTAAAATANEIEEVLEHPVLDLLKTVNNNNNQFDTFELLSLYLDLTGDAFWYIEDGPLGIPQTIWILPSQWVEIVPDKKQFIKGFLFGRNPMQQKAFSPDEVIWFNLPNPADPYDGRSRVAAAWGGISGYDAYSNYELSLLENNGIPPTMINYNKGQLTPEQRRDLQAKFNAVIQSVAAKGRSFVADESIETKDLAVPARDIAMLRAREWRRDEIISAFGQTLALYDSHANRANIEGAIYIWQQDEISPSLCRIEQKLNEKLIPRYKEPRLFLAFDPIIERDRAQEREDDALWLRNGMPINQVLRRRGIQEVDGGDIGYIASSFAPLGSEPAGEEPTKSLHYKPRSIPAPSSRSLSGGRAFKGTKPNDEDRTGGENPPLSGSEQVVAGGVSKVFRQQKPKAVAEAAKMAAADFEWVASEQWADEIVALCSGALAVEIQIGMGKGAMQLGVALTDYIDQPQVQAAAHAHSYQFARAIGRDSVGKLQAALQQGIEAGESIQELSKRIAGVYDGWEKWRTKMIARTESARAITTGQLELWRETGIVHKKIWKANGDACPFCLEMDGKVLELEKSFFTVEGPNQTVEFEGKEITMQHEYLDVDGPPLHPNCRCDIQAVVDEDPE